MRQQRQLRDRQVAHVVRAMLKLPGFNVFKFENGNGELVPVTRRHINEYIKEVMGDSFSAKDFRTWAGTLSRRARSRVTEKTCHRRRAPRPLKRIVEAIKETSEVLGNTPAVCRSAYVCPEILHSFEKGRVIDHCSTSLDSLIAFRGHGLHKAERALVRFLKRK